MPNDQQKQTRYRQKPVSCNFCRTRKLRCSRTAPCSNCISRSIVCDLKPPSSQQIVAPDSSSENSEIIERLHRLESLLLAQNDEVQGQNLQPADNAATGHQSTSSSTFQPIDSTVGGIDNLHGDKINQVEILRNHLVFKICPIQSMTKAQAYVYQKESDPFHPSAGLSRCIWLPPRTEAKTLLEKFIRVSHHFPYVTHIPSLSFFLERIYADVNQGQKPDPGQAMLLLSIFAAAAYSWIESDCAYGAFATSEEASGKVSLWIKAAEDVLSATSRTEKVSIEGVQGVMLVGFLVAHLDGLHRYRALFSVALVLARDLGLHRIDHPQNSGKASTSQAEIERRVWWYLCASDWAMAARVGGVGDGVYSCHPRQMITKKPLNINDDEVFDGMSRDERPLSLPTTMSYTLQRIRLAEIARSIVDRSPLAMAHTGGLSHDAVMDLDTELQTLINEVPAFYAMSGTLLMKTYGLTETRAAETIFQGKVILFLLYSQRCKLHLPYFIQSSEDSAYYSSREICIKHARLLIRSNLWSENADIENVIQYKLTELLIGVFLACAILLRDLCVNPESPELEKQREEIFRSFKIMDVARKGSEATSNLVDSLVRILRKNQTLPLDFIPFQQQHSLTLNGRGENGLESQAPICEEMPFGITGSSRLGGVHDDVSFLGASQHQFTVENGLDSAMEFEGAFDHGIDDIISYWNDFTHNVEEGVEIDPNTFDWDGIFMELDSSII